MLEKLGESLKGTFERITRAVFVDEKLINELVKDIQRALLQSDVNVKLVFELTKRIKEKALNEKLPPGLSKKEHLIKIVYDELVKFLGEKESRIEIKKKPYKIMLVGLFGNGKTTTAGKLAKYFMKRGYKAALVCLDVWRPAAYEQLLQVGKNINVPVFGDPKEKNALNILKKFEKELKKYDILIYDTAGRDALSKDLIEELNKIGKALDADERLLVIGADVGQAAEKQATAFHEACNVNGVIITKMDGTAKGGGALAACAVTGAKVKFIGVGEKVDDFEHFDPKRFISRLIGMGDIETLLEKAKEAIPEKKAEELGKKLLRGEFNMIDLYEQLQAMSKMGPLSKVIEMIPGFSQIKLPKEALQVQEDKLKKWRFIMDSCTKEELENPEIITGTRIERIAKGSGVPASEVRELLKQYKMAKKMAKMMKGGSIEKMMKKLGGKMPKV